jgi:hypothetical protein
MNNNEDFNDVKTVAKFLLACREQSGGISVEEAIIAFSNISGYDVALLKNIVYSNERK